MPNKKTTKEIADKAIKREIRKLLKQPLAYYGGIDAILQTRFPTMYKPADWKSYLNRKLDRHKKKNPQNLLHS